ncbi:hypothetical protein RM550_33940 [Streptomyces sp. DSM 41527]|uniref:Uncharacterized protein n=1 Tax=Streptomyces mooreae TaxID=3075523 RepID=A0ABU2TI95_9ACTN|nr:hypothetical protein [Streptomyces sp. DSM 41527]MDT0460671.1 hypothetical protein [Streptomyces sp. DSM 41527]
MRIRGQEFDFEDHWILSGRGNWKALDSYKGGRTVARGRMVQLTIKNGESHTAKVGQDQLDGSPAAPADRKKSPTTYTWAMSIERTGKSLRMYYVAQPGRQRLTAFRLLVHVHEHVTEPIVRSLLRLSLSTV